MRNTYGAVLWAAALYVVFALAPGAVGHHRGTQPRDGRNGRIIVLADPPGAEVSIDGKIAGTSDAFGEFAKDLPAGTYSIRISADAGYVPDTRTVQLQAGKVLIVRAPLSRVDEGKYGLVVIGPAREGGKVFVDGQEAARVTFDNESNTVAVGSQAINMGAYQDPNNTFVYGGIGFRTVAGEQFSIDELFVQPGDR